MSNTIKELRRFQTERKLHEKPFDEKVAVLNVIEELFEMIGVHDNKERVLATDIWEEMKITKELVSSSPDWWKIEGTSYKEPTTEEKIDALCDTAVFALGDIMKLGYEPDMCLAEVAKEINSRTGEIIEGKFQKYKTPEAMDLWYEADFSKCKMNGS